MNTMPSPKQSEFIAASLRVKPSVEAPSVRQADLKADLKNDESPPEDASSWRQGSRSADPKNDPLPERRSWLDKLAPVAFARYLVVFFIGVSATLAWQAYGGAARELIAPAAASADQQRFNAMGLDLDTVRQSIDRVATSIATGQEQITRSIDQLAAGQEQMTREITKLQAVEQYVLYKNAEPAQRPAAAPKPVWRPAPVAH
jgi:hypothetical protein